MTTDRTTATDDEFDAALAGWEAGEPAAEGWEQRVETAARAIYETDSGNPWADCWFPPRWRRLAAAALHADADTRPEVVKAPAGDPHAAVQQLATEASKLPWQLVGGTHEREIIDDHGCHVATTGTIPDAALIVAAVNALSDGSR